MAVHATPSHGVVDSGLPARDAAEKRRRLPLSAQLRDVPAVRRVALVAQEGRPRLQQIFRGGAVGVMAVRTVFGDRLVGMHERSTLLHVTGIASLVHAIALHELRSNGAVRIVAIAAAHLAFGYWVMRGLADLRALFLVAGE